MSGGRTSKQRVPLDLFLSGMLGGSLGESDHPVIVVDESKRRSFPSRMHNSNNNKDNNRSQHSASSFCSSVTSGSFDSFHHHHHTPAASRWDSMPSSSRNKGDNKLRVPTRDTSNHNRLPSTTAATSHHHHHHSILKRPSRTRTNDLSLKKTPSRKKLLQVPKKGGKSNKSRAGGESFRASPCVGGSGGNSFRNLRRHKSLHCGGGSDGGSGRNIRERTVSTKIHASI